MSRNCTLAHLAQSLKLDKSTVAKALKDNPRIAQATRQRVKQAAREIGYRPNALLSRMAATRWKARPHEYRPPVMVLMFGSRVDFLAEMHAGLATRLEELGYRSLTCHTFDAVEAKRRLNTFYQRGGEGVILGPTRHLEDLGAVRWDRFSVVGILSGPQPSPFHTVRPDLAGSVLAGMERLRAEGCRRVGLMVFDEDSPYDEVLRCGGFMYACQQPPNYGRPHPVLAVPLAGEGPGTRLEISPQSFQRIQAWVRREELDGVIGLNDFPAYWLEAAGFRIPQQLKYLALSITVSPCIVPGFRRPDSQMAHAAAGWLDQLIRHGLRGVPALRQDMLVSQPFEPATPTPALNA